MPDTKTPTTGTVHPFRRVRNAGVPLIAYETGDPWASIQTCLRALNGRADTSPAWEWDCLRGLVPLNESGKDMAGKRGLNPAELATLPVCLGALREPNPEHPDSISPEDPCRLPPGGIVFFHNAQRFLDDAATVQGLCNLRNVAKGIGATLCLMGPGFTLPVELKDDIITIEEPSPTEADITRILTSTVDDARKAAPGFPDPDQSKVVDTLLGYRSEFAVEQSLALSLSPAGVDQIRLWNLKVQSLKQTAGLEVTLPEKGFEALAGCQGAKHLFNLYLHGREKPRCVLWLDEIEKMIAGSGGGDTSGVTQGLVEQFLFWTEERKVIGALLLGIPGAGKSATCKAVAGEAKIPLLRASMSTVKSRWVGQSEGQMRQLLKSVDAVSQGRVLMLATCNSLDALSPEIMARFKLATFFYDFPDVEERSALWTLYQKQYGLEADTPPASPNWVGREIEACCQRAWMFQSTLAEASKTIVPVAIANQARMNALRQSVSGRFLSAARPGTFEYKDTTPLAATAAPGRKINF